MNQGREVFINIYRVYDVAFEVDLDKATSTLLEKNPNKFKLKKHSKELLLSEAPIALDLGEQVYILEGREFELRFHAKIWAYGAISVLLKFRPKEQMSLIEFNNVIEHVEESDDIESMARDKASQILKVLENSAKKSSLSEQYEDYTIIQFVNKEPSQIEDTFKEDIYRMMEGEGKLKLSQQTKESIRQSTYQYSENDLAVVDWNRSVLVGERSDVEELSDILEFAVCQLLELRYYDDFLDKKLESLYDSLEQKKASIWLNRYSRFSEEAAILYLEFSEVIDKVGNSLKLVGDTYYAKIFRAAVEKFRLGDWKTTVSSKLTNLAQLSELFSSEINERRNQLMELIIIVLIAIEVVPFLYNLLK